DALEWTFNLREDSVWSNAAPVTSHDILYAWKRVVDRVTASEFCPYMMSYAIINAAEINTGEIEVAALRVTAIDDYTLLVELDSPVPYFESLMAFGTYLLLNKDFVEEQGDDYAQTSDNLLYNGPFKLEDWESTSDSWNVVKNMDFWDADTVE